MPYIGQQPTSVAFLTDTFSGNGSTTAFTLSAAPANTSSVLVAVSGVLQDPSTYSVSGTTLTFSGAPPSGTSNISVRFLGIPASGVTTTAYRTVTEFTATAGQTSFSVPSYTVGFIDVYRNGVMLGSADYTATTGTTVVLASGATAGDLVEVISFQVSSVLNAIPATAGSVGASNLASGSVTPAKLSTGGPSWDTSGNLGIGTSSPGFKLQVIGTSQLGLNAAGTQQVLQLNNSDTTAGTQAVKLGFSSSGVTKASINAAVYGNDFLTFNTGSDTERMRINASGQITMPFQPAFSASKSGNQSISAASATKITLDQTSFNTGSHFNTSTNRFTAPVAGRYLFTGAIQFTGSVGQPHATFSINGTTIEPWLDWGASVLTAAFQSRVINLAANDYVELFTYITTSGTASGPRCVLSGYLIG
jgi:hypothetical protein